jgi:hypothetical protein
MAAEESVLIADVFHIACIFRKDALMMIGAKKTIVASRIELNKIKARP